MILNFFKNKKAERDRKKLIAELETGGMANLVKQMDNREPYSSVIKQRREKEASYSNTDTISWQAYLVEDKLQNIAVKPELLQLLDDNNFQQYRKLVFCCLASLCANTSDYELFNFLTQQITKETDEGIIISVLSRLGKLTKPANIDLSIVKQWVVEGTEGIRIAAIRALANSRDAEAEDILLSEFKVSDTNTQVIICTTLRSVGTIKSIAVLNEVYRKTRKPHLKEAIESVLSKIKD